MSAERVSVGEVTCASCRHRFSGNFAQLAVADSGSGITAEVLERMFDPFFSTKDHQGTGLGLSVSYGIIRNHGGSIEVQSEVGSGTTFTIELPLLQLPLEEESAPQGFQLIEANQP